MLPADWIHRRRSAVVALMAVLLGGLLSAAAAETGTPTLPGRPCATPGLARPEWTQQERWVWEWVCKGEIADFNQSPVYGGELDPKEPDGWPESRVLRPEFVETILLHEPFRGALTRHGVQISGAWFRGHVDLRRAELGSQLRLVDSRFDEGASLVGLQTRSLMSFDRSVFEGQLSMDSSTVASFLSMHDGEFGVVDLRHIHAEMISVIGSRFTGKLNLNGAQVRRGLFMRSKKPSETDASPEPTEFEDLELLQARVGALEMTGSKFKGKVNMNLARIDRTWIAKEADFSQVELGCDFLTTGGSVDLRGAQLGYLSLQGAAIGGQLILSGSQKEPVWAPGSVLDLRHAVLGWLRVRPGETRPDSVLLEGCSYRALGGLSQGPGSEDAVETLTSTREAADFVEFWLREEPTHSPRAHEQFARILSEAGLPRRARNTLYESKNHELALAWSHGEIVPAIGLSAQWALIGYGHRLWRSLWWIVGLVVVGWVVARRSKVTLSGSDERLGFWFSLDRLLPIIKLRESHYKVEFAGWRQVYFYFHALMGWVLATFLVAAVSGLVG